MATIGGNNIYNYLVSICLVGSVTESNPDKMVEQMCIELLKEEIARLNALLARAEEDVDKLYAFIQFVDASKQEWPIGRENKEFITEIARKLLLDIRYRNEEIRKGRGK